MAVLGRIQNFFHQLIDPEFSPEREEAFDKYRTVEEFGYRFNHEGQLRSRENGSRFQYECYGNESRDRRRYSALGKVITEHVYDLLEKDCQLYKSCVPINASHEDEAFSFIFVSRGALQQRKLLLLIHGSGKVRAGQWSRSLIINDCLDSGTQIPYIKHAIKEGYGVLVLNPNNNCIDGEQWEREREKMRATYGLMCSSDFETRRGSQRRKHYHVRGNESPDKHLKYVWEHFVRNSGAEQIFVVAFSYGGISTVNLVNSQPAVMDRLTAVAFADSVHNFTSSNRSIVRWFQQNSVHWVSSSEELDTGLTGNGDVCAIRSAGTPFHDRVPCTAMEAIFKYLRVTAEEVTRSEDLGGRRDSLKM